MMRKILPALSELVELGTVISLSFISFNQSDEQDTGYLTFKTTAMLLGLLYSTSKYFEKCGMVNEAQQRDDKHFPTEKPKKEDSLLVKYQNQINQAGTTLNVLTVIGLVSGTPSMQKACAVLAPISAELSTYLTELSNNALENLRKNAVRQKANSAPAYQDNKQQDAEHGNYVALVDEAVGHGDLCSLDLVTLRNLATFMIIASTIVLSYLAIEKNDMSSDKVITFSLLAKIMNFGLAASSTLKALSTSMDAIAYDNEINPETKSPITKRQEVAKWGTFAAIGAEVAGLVGLFAGTPVVRKVSSVATPLAAGVVRATSSVFADEMRENAHQPRPGRRT